MKAVARQRALSEEVSRSRAAATAIGPTGRQIGLWQEKAAWLAARGEKLYARGAYEPRLAAEAEALAQTIDLQASSFEAAVSTLPPEIAGHGRVHDMRRAFESAAAQAARALRLVGGTAGGEVQDQSPSR